MLRFLAYLNVKNGLFNARRFLKSLSTAFSLKKYYRKQKTLTLRSGFLMWYLQESNQGHKDFQSFALPTELRYQPTIGLQRYIFFISNKRVFIEFLYCFQLGV